MWGAGKPQQWLAGCLCPTLGTLCSCVKPAWGMPGHAPAFQMGGETWDEGWRRLSFLEKTQILLVHPWLCILSSLVGKQHGVLFLNCSFTSIKAIKGAGVHLEWPFWSHTCAVLHNLCHDGNFLSLGLQTWETGGLLMKPEVTVNSIFCFLTKTKLKMSFLFKQGRFLFFWGFFFLTDVQPGCYRLILTWCTWLFNYKRHKPHLRKGVDVPAFKTYLTSVLFLCCRTYLNMYFMEY